MITAAIILAVGAALAEPSPRPVTESLRVSTGALEWTEALGTGPEAVNSMRYRIGKKIAALIAKLDPEAPRRMTKGGARGWMTTVVKFCVSSRCSSTSCAEPATRSVRAST